MKLGLLERLKRYKINFLRNKKPKQILVYSLSILNWFIFSFFLNQKKQNKKPNKVKNNTNKIEVFKDLKLKKESQFKLDKVKINELQKTSEDDSNIKPVFKQSKIKSNIVYNLKKASNANLFKSKTVDNQIILSGETMDKIQQLKKECDLPEIEFDINISKITKEEATEKTKLLELKIDSKKVIINEVVFCDKTMDEIKQLKQECYIYKIKFDIDISELSEEEVIEKMKLLKLKVESTKEEIKFKKRETLRKKSFKVKMNEIILSDIQNQKKKLDGLSLGKNLFYKTGFLTNHILFNLMFLNLFKNKILNLFITSIMINNQLKLINSLFLNKQKNYELINEDYYTKKILIKETNRININSLIQIEEIKVNLLNYNYKSLEFKSVLNEIELIENRLKEMLIQMNKHEVNLGKQYVKVKENKNE